MQKKGIIVAVVLLFSLFLAASCKSTPPAKPETQTPVETPEPEAAPVREEPPVTPPESPEVSVNIDDIKALIEQAKAKRDEITGDNIADDDGRLSGADSALADAEKVVGTDGATTDDLLGAQKNAQDALAAYNAVFDAFWLGKANDARKLAQDAQQEALKIKADVAVKDDYNASAAVFNNGEAQYKTKKYKDSVKFYTDCTSLFANATALAAEKKRLAALALQSADRKIEESERIAADADSVLAADASLAIPEDGSGAEQ